MSDILVVAISLIAGWVALLPMLRATHPAAYHLFSFPTGLLAWAMATALAALTPLPFWLASIVSVPLFVAGCHALLRRVGCESPRLTREDAPGFALAGILVLGTAWTAASAGYSVVTDDGWVHYAVYATRIWIDGSLSPVLMGHRNVLLPSIMAAQRLFGGEWPLALFPVIALQCAAAVLMLVSLRPGAPAGTQWNRVGYGAVTGLLMAVTGPFLLHSLYVHTNLMSAMFLTLAVTALLFSRETDTADPGADAGRLGFLVIAGVMTSGLALSRNDGIAYTLVPMVLFANGWLVSKGGIRELTAFFLPILVQVTAVFGAALLTLGLWDSEKLTGKMALVGLAGVVAAPVLLGLTWRWRDLSRVARTVSGFSAFLSVTVAALAIKYHQDPAGTQDFFMGLFSSLFKTGGWGPAWYALVGTWVIGLAFISRVEFGSRTKVVGFSVVASFLLAFLARHSLHEPTWADSLNRLVLHFIPMSFALSGLIAAGLRERLFSDDPARS